MTTGEPRGGLVLAVKRLSHAEGLPLPGYASAGAAGLDLVAALPEGEPLIIPPRGRALMPTGLVLALPPDHEGQIRPRSGLALRQGLTVLNAPGTIDADYRGEIGVLLVNCGDEPVTVRRGMRIAQMVIAPVVRADIVAVEAVDSTARGASGFGSTGADAGAKDERP